jgi:hypothetical protein
MTPVSWGTGIATRDDSRVAGAGVRNVACFATLVVPTGYLEGPSNMKRTRVLGLLGAAGLVIGMVAASAGGAAAVDEPNTTVWTGQGWGTNGNPTCDETSQTMRWNFTDNLATSVTLYWPSGSAAMDQHGGGGWYVDAPYFTPPADESQVYVTWAGTGSGEVTLSGCDEGTTTSSTTEQSSSTTEQSSSTTEQSSSTTEQSSSTTEQSSSTTEETSTTTEFTGGQSGETAVPSEPNTATIGDSGTSGPSNGSWLLIAALGMLVGSVIVLTPSRVKNKR